MKRDLRLDYIRVIGILLVILAHTSLNNYVSNIRTFDVAMLVCVAGASYTYSKPIHSCKDYITYVKKRFIRLVVPVWIFLTFYFILTAFMKGEMVYSISTMTSTYLLINGIGYVWIFRIMLMMALINPLLFNIKSKIENSITNIIVFLMTTLLINEVGVFLLTNSNFNIYFCKVIEFLVFYTMGYGILSFAGMLLPTLSRKKLLISIVTSGLIFVFTINFYGGFMPNSFKYPPMMQFISYGLFITYSLYLLFSLGDITNIKINSFVVWFSKHAMNIYLTHILVIFLLGYFRLKLVPIIHYVVIVLLSVCLTYLYYFIKERLLHGKC